MIITNEQNLCDFDFWSGAKDTRSQLTQDDLEQIEFSLSDVYPEGIDATTLNDIFWFECDWLAEILGYENWEHLLRDRSFDAEDMADRLAEEHKSIPAEWIANWVEANWDTSRDDDENVEAMYEDYRAEQEEGE